MTLVMPDKPDSMRAKRVGNTNKYRGNERLKTETAPEVGDSLWASGPFRPQNDQSLVRGIVSGEMLVSALPGRNGCAVNCRRIQQGF